MPLLAMGALPLYFVRLPDDDRAITRVIVGVMIKGRTDIFLRGAWEPDVWDALKAHPIFDQPVPIIVDAATEAPGIVAKVGTIIPSALLPREYWGPAYEGEEWSGRTPGPNENTMYPMGTLVRYQRAMVHQGNLPLEVTDMLRNAASGKAVEPWVQGLGIST